MYTTKTQGTDNTNGSLQLSPRHTAAVQPMVAVDTLHLPPHRLQPHRPEDEVNSGKAVHAKVIYGITHPRHISGTDTVRHFNLGPSTPCRPSLRAALSPSTGHGGRRLTISAASPCRVQAQLARAAKEAADQVPIKAALCTSLE